MSLGLFVSIVDGGLSWNVIACAVQRDGEGERGQSRLARTVQFVFASDKNVPQPDYNTTFVSMGHKANHKTIVYLFIYLFVK